VHQAPEHSIDPHKIDTIGDSAGGHLGAPPTLTHYARCALLAQPDDRKSETRAKVGVHGAYDVAPLAGAEQWDLYTLAVSELLGAMLPEAPQIYR
jgi:acetyl esterase/lipase